jgi:hypothetical protein
MSQDKVGSAGAARGAHGPQGAGAGASGPARASTFAGSTFRLVATPAALQKPPSPNAFEKQVPLRSLAATGVQRQLLRDNTPRAAKPAGAAAAFNAQAADPAAPTAAADEHEPADREHDDTDGLRSRRPPRERQGAAAGGMAQGRGDSVASSTDAAAEPKGAQQRYRVIAQQSDRQQAQEQFFARSGLPGAALLTAAGEPTVVRPMLRLALATGLRASADLPLRSDALPSPQSAQMGLVQAYLQIAPRDEAGLNLAGVKQLLVEVCEQLPPRSSEGTPAGERRSDLLLLLPLMLLNAERPRTAEQRQAARDRLGLMRNSRAMF